MLELIEKIPGIDSNSLRDRIFHLLDTIQGSYFELGCCLSNVYKEELYLKWGFMSFNDYVECELGMKERKAKYLMSIYENAFSFGILSDQNKVDKLVELGWVKANKVLQAVKLNGDYDVWVEKASSMGFRDFQKEVKSVLNPLRDMDKDGNKTTSNSVGENIHLVKFGLYDSQYDNISLALEKAKELAGTEKDGHALDMICLDFLCNNTNYNNLGQKIIDWVDRGFVKEESD